MQEIGEAGPGAIPEAQDHEHPDPQQQEAAQGPKEDPEEHVEFHAQVLTVLSPGRVDGEGHTAAAGPTGQVLALASMVTVASTARGHAGEAALGAIDQVIALVAIAFEVSLQRAHVQGCHIPHVFPGDGLEDHVVPGLLPPPWNLVEERLHYRSQQLVVQEVDDGAPRAVLELRDDHPVLNGASGGRCWGIDSVHLAVAEKGPHVQGPQYVCHRGVDLCHGGIFLFTEQELDDS